MEATPAGIGPDQPEAYFNRELSWLAFARRDLQESAHAIHH